MDIYTSPSLEFIRRRWLVFRKMAELN